MELEAYARTDPGPVRENNEDNMLLDLHRGIFMVADGMGAHAFGEVAAEIAVDVVHRILCQEHEDPDETRLMREVEVEEDADKLRERLRYAMNQASIAIRRKAVEMSGADDMGTTLVVLIVDEEQAHLAHVGDSRAYLYRDARLIRLTRDHTVVQQEIDAGRLTPELARLVPQKNILTQSVGFHGVVEPDTSTRFVHPGDLFILCSDGLTDTLTDAEIGEIAKAHPADMLADALVETALSRGAQDNVTALSVLLGP
ncbi:MAG: serine/threonine-protein phosphatase [Deltaproteobacteria bacterium]|nr:MAG: serine/threonine-protein phosphatase [Deltaproteobacteria bacterium]